MYEIKSDSDTPIMTAKHLRFLYKQNACFDIAVIRSDRPVLKLYALQFVTRLTFNTKYF